MVNGLTKLEKPIKFHWKCKKCKVPIEGELTHVVTSQLRREIQAFQALFDAEIAQHECRS